MYYSSINSGEEEIDSTQPLKGAIGNNNQGNESPEDPNNKKDNIKKAEISVIKTPILPNTIVKLYDHANNSKLDMLSDLKTPAVIYM